VCELDIIFSFTKAYYILDELLLAGELQESSKKAVLRCISQQDSLEDMEVRCVLTLRPAVLLHVYHSLGQCLPAFLTPPISVLRRAQAFSVSLVAKRVFATFFYG